MFTDIFFYLRIAALSPQFASNPFLSAFFVGLLLRLQWIEGPQDVFVSETWVLVGMGILALAQTYAETEPDLRAFWYSIDTYVKTGIYILVSQDMVDPQSVFVLNLMIGQVSPLVFIWSWLTSAGLWVVNRARKAFYELMGEADEDDDLGVQFFAVLTENIWVLIGVWLALVIPVLSLALAALAILTVYWLEKKIEGAENRQRVGCAVCETPMQPTALVCPGCKTANPSPVQMNLLGQPTERPVIDTEAHKNRLLGLRRCPQCATRLPDKKVQQSCPSCQTVTFASAQELARYLGAIHQQLPLTLVICFLCGLLPVAGLLPGILYYRFAFLSGVRRYLPRTIGFGTKWGVRILNGALILLQPVPVLGGFLLPLMCYTNYTVYRRAMEREGRRIFA